MQRLITHLSWKLEEGEGVTAVLKVLVILETILEVVGGGSGDEVLKLLDLDVLAL